MRTVDVSVMHEMFISAAECIIEKEPYLTEIDSIIGDGDHGTGMKRGFTAVKGMLERNTYDSMPELVKAVSIELIRSMGGASGVIFGTMFFGGISRLTEDSKADISELADYFYEGEKAIEKRGKSSPGQKTMLDALYPAVCAMKAYDGDDAAEFFEAAWRAAAAGAEESRKLISRKGRSSNFGDECIGLPDPGAVSTSIIFEAFYNTVKQMK
ncbi:MAG: dihydroxyacetone kinase subunit DhaL [Anaerovoracaceae bacterium]